jgi:hypothetical protein
MRAAMPKPQGPKLHQQSQHGIQTEHQNLGVSIASLEKFAHNYS